MKVNDIGLQHTDKILKINHWQTFLCLASPTQYNTVSFKNLINKMRSNK
jgi:hypothetical protein